MSRPKVHPEYGGELTYYKDLPVGTVFYVANGHWEGEIIEEEGLKKVYVQAMGMKFTIPEDSYGWLTSIRQKSDERLTGKVTINDLFVDMFSYLDSIHSEVEYEIYSKLHDKLSILQEAVEFNCFSEEG